MSILILHGLVCIYALIITLETGVQDTYYTLRSVRALLSIFAVIIITRMIQLNSKANRMVLPIVLFWILTNGIIILIQSFSIEFQMYTASITGFDKGFKLLRGFGLTNGYDTSGIITIFGIIICLKIKNILPLQNIILIFLIVSTFFTSRSTMAFCILALIMHFMGAIKLRKLSDLKGIILLTAIFGFSYLFYLVFLSTETVTYIGSTDDRFASNSVQILMTHFHLPTTDWRVITGVGFEAPYDPGFTKIVWMGGLLGTLIYLSYYFYLYQLINRKKLSLNRDQDSLNDRQIKTMVFCMILILVLANLKNLIFFTRHIHEFITFFVLFLATSKRIQKVSRYLNV
ncbi:hypothetical protein N9R24_05250 [Amylibacter sp.]|nr:hypothetical protein [Amylibacter sp.]